MKAKRLLTMLAAWLTAGAAAVSLTSCGNVSFETTASSEQTAEVCRIGLYTPISGDYLFTSAWGDTGADRDLRSLLHGAENVSIAQENIYAANPSVISAVSTTDGTDGSRTYTYTLVSGLCYSDGSSLTAKDYVFSVLLQSSADFGSLSGDNTAYQALKGYADFASGESSVFTGVRLLSDNCFSLTIDASSLPYYQEMLLTQVYPVPSAVIAPGAVIADDGEGAYLTGMTEEGLAATLEGENGYRRKPMVTAGPYMLQSIENGVYTLAANPYYTGGYYKRQPSVKLMTVETIDPSEDADDYDLIVGITGRDGFGKANKLLSEKKMSTSYSYDSLVVSSLSFSDSVDEGIRLALSQLIDGVEASDLLAGHWGQEPLGNIPLASSLYQSCYADLSSLSAKSYDVSDLLMTAGGGDPITLTYGYDPDDAEASALVSLLQKADEKEPLLKIETIPNGEDTDLRYTRTQYGKDWGAWKGLSDTSLSEMADDLSHTAYNVNSSRYNDKLTAFEQAYMETLPELPLAVYTACDLVGKRLIGYQQVDVYDDWTIWIQYARIVNLTREQVNS